MRHLNVLVDLVIETVAKTFNKCRLKEKDVTDVQDHTQDL